MEDSKTERISWSVSVLTFFQKNMKTFKRTHSGMNQYSELSTETAEFLCGKFMFHKEVSFCHYRVNCTV